MLKNKKQLLIIASLPLLTISLLSLSAETSWADATPQKVGQIKHPKQEIGAQGQTGGLVQSLFPHVQSSNQLQTTQTNSSLGSSGSTDNLTTATITNEDPITPIVGASQLPNLWNPLNASSGNYGKLTQMYNQGNQNICWSFTGTDTMARSAWQQLGTLPSLSPVYYDYLSAGNAFIGAINPLAIMIGSTPRRLSTDGNTLDYVPQMSVQGYLPALASSLPQPVTDQSMSQTTFNALKKTNLQVSDSYKLPGFAPPALPLDQTTRSQRIEQIKQMIYQYGAVQFGLKADYSLGNSQYFNAATSASYVPASALSWQPNLLVYDTDGQAYLNQDHELEMVGYDDDYPAANFVQNPGLNGAFVVKNSWGSDWGDEGYFYLSYADAFVAGSEILADEMTTLQTGEKIYSATNITPEASSWYIPYSGTDMTKSLLFANTFTSQKLSGKTEQLQSVSAYIDQPGIQVNVLYKSGTVSSTTALTSFKNLGSYTFTNAGYQTIPFSPVNLANNSSYTIALQLTNLSHYSTLNVPVQKLSTSGYPILKTGASWIQEGGKWENLSSSTSGANLYLGAKTKVMVNPTAPSSASTSTTKAATVSTATSPSQTKPVYRLYNTRNMEHLYTTDAYEKSQLPKISKAWKYEGVAWQAPKNSSTPVYRVYNPKSGEHLYTKDAYEIKVLNSKYGWRKEGVAFYSGGKHAVYRLFNAAAGVGAHFVTPSLNERQGLVARGWRYEGIAWSAE